mmetsp:Transcript_2735/g.3932  ORF Transcript_2735/g.3932 Transcript_2735/m.3932 type:complete len:403 (-) Transcript_2735:1474-2682(-)
MECSYCCSTIDETSFTCTRCFKQQTLDPILASNEAKRERVIMLKKEIEALLKKENYQSYEVTKNAMDDSLKQTSNQIEDIRRKVDQTILRINYLKESLKERKELYEQAKDIMDNNKESMQEEREIEATRLYKATEEANKSKSQKMKLLMNIFFIEEAVESNRPTSTSINGYNATMKDDKYLSINHDAARLPLKTISGLLEAADQLAKMEDKTKIKKWNQAMSLFVSIVFTLLQASYTLSPIDVPPPTEKSCYLGTANLWIPSYRTKWNRDEYHRALRYLSKLVVLLCGVNGIVVVHPYRHHPLHNMLCLYDTEFMNHMLKVGPCLVYPQEWRKKELNWKIEQASQFKHNYYISQSTIYKLRAGYGYIYASEGAKRDKWPMGYMRMIEFDPNGLFKIEDILNS